VLAQPVQALPMPAHGTVARSLELRVGPLDNPNQADNLIELFQEIVDLGTIEPIDGGQSSDGMRRFKITTTSSDNDLLDLFTFHVAREQVMLLPLCDGYGFHEGCARRPGARGGRRRLRLLRTCPGAPDAASGAEATLPSSPALPRSASAPKPAARRRRPRPRRHPPPRSRRRPCASRSKRSTS
jgi:two-component system chemotaxis sensor kinase CheA